MFKDLKELKEALEISHDKCLRDLNGSLYKETTTLYHYTNLDSGLAILEKSSLRFTDVKYCNDPEEVACGLEILNRVSDELLGFYASKSEPFCVLMSYVLYLLNLSTSFKSEDETLLLAQKTRLEKFGVNTEGMTCHKISIFVSCFSKRADDLRQWLPYANDGRGIALGFKGLNNGHYLTTDQKTYAIKVCYEPLAKKEQFVKDVFNAVFEISKRVSPAHWPYFVDIIYQGLLGDIIACKSENYKDEEEWRLVRMEKSNEIRPQLNFRIRDNIIRPFIEVDIVKDSLLDIKLGPKMENILNVESLYSVFEKYGYSNVALSKSTIAYR